MFKKSQSVLKIGRWNHLGAFYIVPATVVSCGKIQMVLQHAETGECLGRNFKPSIEQYGDCEIRADLTIEQARERALELSAKWIAKDIARMRDAIERAGPVGGDGYVRKMQANIAELEAASPEVLP